MEHVSWTQMADGDRADYEFLGKLYNEHTQGEVTENMVRLLELMKGPKLGYQVDRYEHSLQSASRALRADEPIDMVVAALLHDVGDPIAPENHSSVAAAILRPYVSDETHWVIKHHGLFQGYYYFHHLDGDRNARDIYSDQEHYEACIRFCENYDQNCFDPDYNTLPLADFIPMMEEVFARESKVLGVAPVGFTADIEVT